MSDYISVKEYARKNKLSIFQAVKVAKSGKVETITKEIDGKEQIFIKNDAIIKKEPKPKTVPTIEELSREIEELKKRIEILEKKV